MTKMISGIQAFVIWNYSCEHSSFEYYRVDISEGIYKIDLKKNIKLQTFFLPACRRQGL